MTDGGEVKTAAILPVLRSKADARRLYDRLSTVYYVLEARFERLLAETEFRVSGNPCVSTASPG
ncbi:MAG: hypothetical protein NTU41_05920 [Chloroflexi bacterium]|nr:hypothetical protein [Chloroflexota bacterium]